MSNTTRRLALAAACLLAFTAAGCSSSSKSSSGGSAAAGAPVGLTIQNSTFTPGSVTAGTPFTISNKDGVTHTVTDDAGSFDVRVPGGGSMPLTIPTAGTYKIHCKIHSSMHGTITVA